MRGAAFNIVKVALVTRVAREDLCFPCGVQAVVLW